jgi:hypothetical protein
VRLSTSVSSAFFPPQLLSFQLHFNSISRYKTTGRRQPESLHSTRPSTWLPSVVDSGVSARITIISSRALASADLDRTTLQVGLTLPQSLARSVCSTCRILGLRLRAFRLRTRAFPLTYGLAFSRLWQYAEYWLRSKYKQQCGREHLRNWRYVGPLRSTRYSISLDLSPWSPRVAENAFQSHGFFSSLTLVYLDGFRLRGERASAAEQF